jgi:hypothetical protein
LRLAKVEEAVAGLRHSQNLGMTALGIGLAAFLGVVVYLLTDMSGQLRDVNARIDRVLEAQSVRAQAADARLDRLLETLAAEARRTPAPLSGN